MGLGVARLGIVSLGAGGYFLAPALEEKGETETACTENACPEPAFSTRNDMVKHGNMATIFGIAGAALVGAGAVMYFVGRPSAGDDARTGFSVTVGPSGGLATLQRRF